MTDELSENYMWVAKHGAELDRHPGKWVAIDRAKIIAVSDNLVELAKMPEVKSARHPLFHLVPTEEEANSILIF